MRARNTIALVIPAALLLGGWTAAWAQAPAPPMRPSHPVIPPPIPTGTEPEATTDTNPPPLPPATATTSAPSSAPPAVSSAAPTTPAQPATGIAWLPPQQETPAELQAEDKPTGPTRDMSRDFWQVELGMRSSWIRGAGFDPFSTNNNLTQFSVSATRALLLVGNFSLAAGVLYENGSKDATARAAASKLAVQRFGGVAEGRFHLGRDIYAFAKLVPQAVYTTASLEDASATAELRQEAWRFGLDSTAGAAWNIPRTLGASSSIPEVWLLGEFGYGWTASKDIELKPDVGGSDPNAAVRLNMGPLALNGLMMRASAAITF